MSNRIPSSVLILLAVLAVLVVLAWPLGEGPAPPTPMGLLVLTGGTVARTFRGARLGPAPDPTSDPASVGVPDALVSAFGAEIAYARLVAVDAEGRRHAAWLPRTSSTPLEDWLRAVYVTFQGMRRHFDIVEAANDAGEPVRSSGPAGVP